MSGEKKIPVPRPSSSKNADEEENEPFIPLKFKPNEGNGCDRENYKWTQTLNRIEIVVPLNAGAPLKDCDVIVECKERHLKVGVRGKDPIIDGELSEEIKLDASTWTLEKGKDVNITLQKVKDMNWWSRLITTDPEINTLLIDSDSGIKTRKLFHFKKLGFKKCPILASIVVGLGLTLPILILIIAHSLYSTGQFPNNLMFYAGGALFVTSTIALVYTRYFEYQDKMHS